MDVSDLLDGLNDQQREAVAAPPCCQLVLAGAGSGKTRVLVHRLAWLMNVEQVSPHSMLAVTFTNKAAAEMRSRVEALMSGQFRGAWIGTFHSLAHRLLRLHHQEAGLPEGFQILDSDDQQRLLKRTIRALGLDDKQWPAKQAMWFINGHKDEGERPHHLDAHGDPNKQTWINIYQLYQQTCDQAGLVDFAELLLRAHEMLLKQPALLRHYRQRFRHILVDEFQDTNRIQYAFVRVLAGHDNYVMIVGDDDQSIYGWRGAQVANIRRFLDEFPGAKTIRLEQNYRSTATILQAANAVIAHNHDRLGKELWTDGVQGEPIALYAAFNELDEARFIIGQIKAWQEQGEALANVAILYRSNAQSRVLEEALLAEQLPYRIYGGLRFFERQEIKDALGYLRLMANRNDDAAFERVVNTPTRGIGARTLDHIRQQARDASQSLWQAAHYLLSNKGLSGRAANALSAFTDLIEYLDQHLAEEPLSQQVDITIRHTGLLAMYQAERGEKAQARVDNLEELVTAAGTFQPGDEIENMSPLSAFLAQASLEAGDKQADEYADAVQLMTMHSAKGLEFPLVFLAGVEEGLFPSQQSAEEAGRLEEERRLCYVGMTRAMQRLVITYAESRRLYGKDQYHTASRFLREIPAEYVQEVRLQTQVSRPAFTNRFNQSEAAFEASGLNLGERVLHPKFGEGTVINYEGSGNQARVQVSFDNVGNKWLVVAYARLQPL